MNREKLRPRGGESAIERIGIIGGGVTGGGLTRYFLSRGYRVEVVEAASNLAEKFKEKLHQVYLADVNKK